MVSVKHLEGDYPLLKPNTGSEQLRDPQVFHGGNLPATRVPVYRFGTSPAEDSDSYGEFSCTGDEQSLLDSLLLAQWEDCAWKGLLSYDVTSCETKAISGGKKFIAQLNENWNLNFFTECENKISQLSGNLMFDCSKARREDILFCVATGDKEAPEFIPSATMPKDAILININANPVEYGHIFMVPCNFPCPSSILGKKSLELVTRIAVDINNCSFCAFYDYLASSNSDCLFFQACYFANPLPVELMPVIPLFGVLGGKCIQIGEVADYPVKALVFMCKKNLKILVGVVSEICAHLQDQNTPFNLLISDCGTKMFLFPRVQSLESPNLTAWECGGHFVFRASLEFSRAREEDILKHMAAVSLDDKGFEEVKQLCCNVASKLVT